MAMSQSQTPTTLKQIQLPPGYRFNPDDEELVRFFLYPKLTNPQFTTSAPVRDCNIYAYQPLQIWNTFHRIHGEDVFFFSYTSSNSNAVHKIAGGPATWHKEDKDHQICVQIDKNYSVTALKKSFSYRNTQPHQPGFSWMMYEYSLPSLSQVTVLCQLRRKDDDNTHQSKQTTKKRKSADADGVDDAANTISQKARVHQQNQQQHNMGFYWAAESVSTLNPTENLQLIEVVRIDNDGKAAPAEDDYLYQEILELLNSNGCSGKAGVVPAFEAAPVQADGGQTTQMGSTLIESFTSEVVDHHLDRSFRSFHP